MPAPPTRPAAPTALANRAPAARAPPAAPTPAAPPPAPAHWSAPPAPAGHAFPLSGLPAVPYADPEPLVKPLMVLLPIGVALGLAGLAVALGGWGGAVAEGLLGFASFAVTVALVIVFCLWVARVHRNTRAFGASSLTWGTGIAVGSFFIPFAHLVLPYFPMRQAWRASAEAAGTPAGDGPVLRWFVPWSISTALAYAAAIAGAVIGFSIGFAAATSGQDPADAQVDLLDHPVLLVLQLAAQAATVVAAVFLVLMLRAFTPLQREAARRRGLAPST